MKKLFCIISLALLSIILFSCSPVESELASIEQAAENQQPDVYRFWRNSR